MKRLLLLQFMLTTLVLYTHAQIIQLPQNFKISNIKRTTSVFEYRALGEAGQVDLTFDYVQTGGNVRIYAVPDYNGSFPISATYKPSPVYSTATGTATGFVRMFQPGKINGIHFKIYGEDNTTLLYDTLVTGIHYKFIDYHISFLNLSPSSPAVRAIDNAGEITFNFDFIQSGGKVRIYALPDYNGKAPAGSFYSGAPLYSSSEGIAEGYRMGLAVPGKINGIHFLIYGEDNTFLYDTLITGLNYEFKEYHIHNVTVSPESPAIRPVGTAGLVDIGFDFIQSGENVRIYALPFYKGSPVNGYTKPSPWYTTVTGSGTGFMTLLSPGKIDGIWFKIYAEDNTTLLYDTVVTGYNYSFKDYYIHNVSLSPASPEFRPLGIQGQVDVSFDYVQTGENVRIHAIPEYNGVMSGFSKASPLYSTATGSGTGGFGRFAAGKINSLHFYIYAQDNTTLLYDTIVGGLEYDFREFYIHNLTLNPRSPAHLMPYQEVDVSFDYVASGEATRIYAQPDYNEEFPYAGFHASSPIMSEPTGSASRFVGLNSGGVINGIRFKIYSSDITTVLYDTLVTGVEYTYSEVTGLNIGKETEGLTVYPSPCKDLLTINSKEGHPFTYRIYGATGTLIHTGQSDGDAVEIMVADWPEGIFHIRTESNDNRHSAKFIKN